MGWTTKGTALLGRLYDDFRFKMWLAFNPETKRKVAASVPNEVFLLSLGLPRGQKLQLKRTTVFLHKPSGLRSTRRRRRRRRRRRKQKKNEFRFSTERENDERRKKKEKRVFIEKRHEVREEAATKRQKV